MNETVAILFISVINPRATVIVYEQAEIDFYREDGLWVEVGAVIYDTYLKRVVGRA